MTICHSRPSHPFGSAQIVVVTGSATEVTRGVGSIRNCASNDGEYRATEFAFALHATTSFVTVHGAISGATIRNHTRRRGIYEPTLFAPHFPLSGPDCFETLISRFPGGATATTSRTIVTPDKILPATDAASTRPWPAPFSNSHWGPTRNWKYGFYDCPKIARKVEFMPQPPGASNRRLRVRHACAATSGTTPFPQSRSRSTR